MGRHIRPAPGATQRPAVPVVAVAGQVRREPAAGRTDAARTCRTHCAHRRRGGRVRGLIGRQFRADCCGPPRIGAQIADHLPALHAEPQLPVPVLAAAVGGDAALPHKASVAAGGKCRAVSSGPSPNPGGPRHASYGTSRAAGPVRPGRPAAPRQAPQAAAPQGAQPAGQRAPRRRAALKAAARRSSRPTCVVKC